MISMKHNTKFTLLTTDDSRNTVGSLDLSYTVEVQGQFITRTEPNSNYEVKPANGSARPMYNSMLNTTDRWIRKILNATPNNKNNQDNLYIKVSASVVKEDSSLPLIIEFYREKVTKEPILDDFDSSQKNSNVIYSINGKAFDNPKDFIGMLTTVILKIADHTYSNNNIDVWRKDIRSAIDIPVDIKYALTNRTPYSFFYIDSNKNDITEREVLLNLKRIGDRECAIELSDGVWGSMSFEALQLFINAFRHGKTNSYSEISPRKLFFLTMKRMPSSAEQKLMIHYLMQNRTSDIVSSRASKMLQDIIEKHSDKVFVEYNNNTPDDRFSHIHHIKVRGIGADWKLTPNHKIRSAVDAGRQAVQTRIYRGNGRYSDAICIDNTNNNSPMGDQIATRILATMNDEYMVSRVHTVVNTYDANKGKRDSKIDDLIASTIGEEE